MDDLIDLAERTLVFLGGCVALGAAFVLIVRAAV